MCQPKPGPRCSSHARDTLTRSTKNFQHRDSEYNEELSRLEGMPFDSAEAQSQRSYLDTLAHGRAEAETRMHEAREDYDATPDGMKRHSPCSQAQQWRWLSPGATHKASVGTAFSKSPRKKKHSDSCTENSSVIHQRAKSGISFFASISVSS